MKNCRSCRHSQPGTNQNQVSCHRYPPHLFPMVQPHPLNPNQMQQGFLTAFPEPGIDAVCGEWSPALTMKEVV